MKNQTLKKAFFVACLLSSMPMLLAQKFTDYVDPMIGSGGHGHVFVGASVPYGAVQVGPSNFYKGWDWCSGYNYRDSVIIGFPQLHLSGTGIGDLGDVLIMPYMGDVKLQKGEETERYSGYASQFSHANEIVRPGYYKVTLDDYHIDVELTASERVAFHKYTFPQGKDARIIIDLKEGINDKSVDTYIELTDKYTIKGYRSSEGWAKKQQVFFAIKSSVAITDFSIYEDAALLEGKKGKGKSLKGLITFKESPETIQLKAGISPVSANQALANIKAEIPDWDFAKVAGQADGKWNKELARIQVETSNEVDKRIFYTSLFHLMIHPSLFNDANGEYRGADWKVYKNPGFDNYTIFSLWDTYRAAHPLFTIIDRQRTAGFVNSMLAVFDQTGMLPIWHLRGYDTGTMVGINSFQIIAEAYMKGIEGFDAERAFHALSVSARRDVRGLDFDREMKPIPSDVMKNRPVATALEYAIGTASIALMAKKMGKMDEYTYFKQRSMNYRLYFDKVTGFFRGRMADGSWNPVFDPIKSVRPWATDYAEGNAWQYLWLVPQDVEGLIELLGGEDAFTDRLNTFFTLSSEGDPDVLVDLTGCIGQYAHGNEPGHHISYLYAYAGQPWQTARLTRKIIKDFYHDRPDGIVGNEDCGQMSAWYILSSLGFYPVFTASGQYVLGSPLFDKATINLEGGKQFTIEAIDNTPGNIYIQRVELNGKKHDFSFITHDDIMQGGALRIYMGNTPDYTFGKDPASRPQYAGSPHPRIYSTDDQKPVFANKLKTIDWAKQSYEKIKSDVDPYVDRHLTDPEWIISRMQMYWDTHYERVYVKGNAFSHGTGRAPVPTVKFAGNRDGATDYAMPSLEDTQPYMDEKGMYLQNTKKEGRPWEWVHPSKTGRMIGPMNDRIMKMAADAAFLYWYTGEEKYAVFASGIFLTYVKGMHYRREPFALEDYGNSHLMGLATFEVILDHLIPDMAVCYDFIHGYLKRNGADFNMIATVFKRFAEQQILYGVPDNNWNIFQARHVTYLALALDDNSFYKDGRGKQYYLNEILTNTTIRQFALKEMIDESFDPETGLWPESATYSMSVCKDMLDVICLIDNAENNHLLDTFPILKKAVPATVEYLFPNGRVTAFGDARYVPLRPQPFEMLIALHRKYKESGNEKRLTQALSKLIADSAYNRSENKDMFSLFFYVDKLMDITPAKASYDPLISDTYYAPNVSWLIQRNGRDRQDGMVFTLTGAYGNHAHANGISLEMYGKGLMLAPESSYGITYGTRDNQEYYARFPAHNTVIVDGTSDYAMMRSNHPYRLLSCYPAHGENLLPADKVSFARVDFLEPKTDACQDRLTSMIRTGEKAAYVVDIFRSARKDGKDIKHEYLYHSIGEKIDVMSAMGEKLLLSPTEELSSEAGDMNGYNYFENKQAVGYDRDFKAQFHIGLKQQDDVIVDMWMKGYEGRTLFNVMSPKSNAFDKGYKPEELVRKSLPTLLVRQKGEAWDRPFVAVYQPYTYTEGPSIRSVDYFGHADNFVGIVVQSASRTDYIFNSASGDPDISYRTMQFKGNYAVVGETNGALACLFLGNGRRLAWNKWSITSEDTDVQASLNHSSGDVFELATSAAITLTIPATGRQPELSDIEQPDAKLQGALENGIYTALVPAGKYRIKLY
jgi:predicted alpha-1,2-mannosidase